MQRIPEKKIAEHIHKAIAAHVLERAGIQRVETAEHVGRVMDVLNELYPAKTADALIKHPEVQRAVMLAQTPEEIFRRKIQSAVKSFRASILNPTQHTAALMDLALEGKNKIPYSEVRERARAWTALQRGGVSIHAINHLGIARINSKRSGPRKEFIVEDINREAAEALLKRWKRLHNAKRKAWGI